MLETSRTHGLLKVIVPLSLILSYGPWPFPEKFTLSKQPLIFCYPSPPSMEKILLIKSVSPFPLHPWRKSSGSPFPLHPWRKSSSKSVSPFPLNLWLFFPLIFCVDQPSKRTPPNMLEENPLLFSFLCLSTKTIKKSPSKKTFVIQKGNPLSFLSFFPFVTDFPMKIIYVLSL